MASSLILTDLLPTSSASDKGTANPLAGVTVVDLAGGAETAVISYAAANGALSLPVGLGATLSGSAGGYTLQAGSAATLDLALRALVFTPTANQVTPGQTVATAFSTTVTDSLGQSGAANDVTTVTSVNDGPAVAGAQSGQTVSDHSTLRPFSTVTISDPDVGQATTVTVTLSPVSGTFSGGGFVQTTQEGLYAVTFTAAAGAAGASAAAAQAALQALVYTPAVGAVGDPTYENLTAAVSDGVSTFSTSSQVTVTHTGSAATQGASGQTAANSTATTPATTTLSTATLAALTSVVPAPTPLSVQQNLPAQVDNLLRVASSDSSLSNASSPNAAVSQAAAAIAAQLDNGSISHADAQSALLHLVDGTTSVAEISYAFFTGKTPTASGLSYLLNSQANPANLNGASYSQMTTENRYINFAVNLATGAGEGASQFAATYGGLSLADAVSKAYTSVFGFAPSADKVDAILNAVVPNGAGGTETRAQYLSDLTGGSAIAQKAAAVGFLLADSVHEGFGSYQQADMHFLQDLAHGTALFNVDLLGAYGSAPALVGTATSDPTLGG